MNQDQLANIQKYCENIGEVITKCRDYVHLLRGLHLARLENRKKSEHFAIALDVMYRSTWEALFAAFGTLIDRTSNTYSLSMLLKQTQKYAPQNHPIKPIIKAINKDLLDPENTPMVRMKLWRMKFVAHHSKDSRSDGFHAENKIHFDEADDAINQIEAMVNGISSSLLDTHYEFRLRDSENIEKQVQQLFQEC